VIAVGVLAQAAGHVAEPPLVLRTLEPPTFNLQRCNLGATDIVVTDPDGRVLECWRGELKPGDVVRLGPARLTPTNTLSWDHLRLRPDRTLSVMYHPGMGEMVGRRAYVGPPDPFRVIVWPDVPEIVETELRLVLFLRKDGTTGAGAVWMPADSVPTPQLGYYFGGERNRPPRINLPHKADIDFSASVAWVEAGRVLALQDRPLVTTRFSRWSGDRQPQLGPIALSLNEFNDEVSSLPAALKMKGRSRRNESGTGESLRTWANFVTLTQYPPQFPPRNHP
jgi:hypothetical protein